MKTLRRCVLVCRAWHDCFRRLLFSHVVIRSYEAYESLRQYALGKSPTASHLILTQLLEITDDGHQWPLILGRYMPNIRCLCLRAMNAPLNRHLATSLSQFNVLEHLMIETFVFYSFGNLHRLICALPNLRELYLASGRLSSHVSTSDMTFTPEDAPCLRTLYLHDLEPTLQAPLAAWTVSTSMCRTVTSLVLSGRMGCSQGVPYVTRMLRALGPSLTHLEYHIYTQEGISVQSSRFPVRS